MFKLKLQDLFYLPFWGFSGDLSWFDISGGKEGV